MTLKVCTNPDPAVEPHEWVETPTLTNPFHETCTTCFSERINMQRELAYKRAIWETAS
jgi:hypothetical protein